MTETPPPATRVDAKYRKAKKAFQFALIGAVTCVLCFPASFAAQFVGVQFVACLVERSFQVSLVAIATVSLGLATWSIMKMEEKTWLACVSALLAFVELWFGATMLAHEFTHRPL